ncbi:Platelet glycoprotein V [Bagarius yarrelli]|uniref:Platelet glycoprotein V n=1 Tax=Bagarius yarrelli TaxID=175774 RepID=A0A556VCB9_BAGYA|nr:Platelet glycoprotein V [Bagarius yarrelli]
MPRLQEFYLYNTNLTTLPWNFLANMTGLKALNLHFNEKLTSLPRDLFCCLPKLQKLSLKFNMLQDLHQDQFSALINLRMLLLSGNELRSLSAKLFQNLQTLTNLELSNNNLRNLPGDIFVPANALRSVTLGNNKWNCTCSILDIAEWISANRNSVTDMRDVLCHEPYSLLNKPLVGLTSESLQCGVTPDGNLHVGVTTERTYSLGRTTTLPFTSQGSASNVGTDFLSPSTLHLTPLDTQASSTTALTTKKVHRDVTTMKSKVFFDTVVLVNGPDIVHNNRHQHWVYLWTVPATGPDLQ